MGYDVSIQRLGMSAVIDLQGRPDDIAKWVEGKLLAFPDAHNRYTRNEEIQLCWIAPERWLLRSALDNEDRLLEMTRPQSAPLDISIVEVSDTLCFFEISGPDAGDIISIAAPIDHHPDVFPADAISYTNLFGIKGLVMRSATGFEIAVESSFADMLDDYLARANA